MGALKRELPRRRVLIVIVALALAAVTLVARAVDLQIVQRDFLQGQGDARHVRTLTDEAIRGVITDRHGEVLAMSAPVESIWAQPGVLAGHGDRIAELAAVLDRDPVALKTFVETRAAREFVYLRRHLSPEQAQRVLALGIPGVQSQREYRRFYPHGEVSAHVVGFADIDENGLEGVERSFDAWLSGTAGTKRVVRDRYGRHARDVASIRPTEHGHALELRIDQRLQYIAHLELKAQIERHRAQAGSAVLIEARTGDIMAMVNWPAGNPNDRDGLSADRMRNRAVTDNFEPGSVIKPITVAAALDAGVVQPGDTLATSPGTMRVGRLTVRDFRNYGTIDLATLIARSSNVGATQLALRLESQAFWDVLQRAGFGQRPGLSLSGETPGLLRDFTSWRQVEQATMSYGYGLSTSLVQLAGAYTAFANGGERLPLNLVRVANDPREPVRVMRTETANRLLEMMERTISVHGTARQAQISGYRIAGKTGTSRKAGVGGYTEDRYVSVFIGLAPASDPRFVMAVMIDEPDAGEYYGGAVAAPVFARVVERALHLYGVAPDARPPSPRLDLAGDAR